MFRTHSSSPASQTVELKLSGSRLPRKGMWCSRHFYVSRLACRKVGDRIVHINGVPVFQQLDFLQVLSGQVAALGNSRPGGVICGCIPGAMRDFHRLKQPIVVTTVDPTP